MEPIQVAENIIVRPFEKVDAAEMYQAIQDNQDHLKVWFGWPEYHATLEDTAAWIEGCGSGPIFEERAECGIWMDDRLVGSFGFEKGNILNHSVGVGYWLAKSETGKGLMTKVTRAVCKHLFSNQSVNRITIRAIKDNAKSCAIPERLNFTFEGIERHGISLRGNYFDVKVYSLLAHEFDLM